MSARQETPGGTAVRGDAKDGGTGVKGVITGTTGTTGIGVWGETPGTGSAVFGDATGQGVGIYGTSTNGTGVSSNSTNGTALQLNGKARFSRRGTVTITAGATSRVVTLANVSTASMVLATSQQNAAVSVRAVVPAGNSFTIRVTGAAPTGGLKVAYFVLN